MTRLVLGVDGGNSKTVAAVATLDGEIVGAGRAGPSDIYFFDPAYAMAQVAEAVGLALGASGAALGELAVGVFTLAGADLPEDLAFLTSELTAALPALGRVVVANDALGSVWAGHADGVGVIANFGTHLAIGARGPDGRVWHSSNQLEFDSGAVGIGKHAVRAVWRDDLALEPAGAFAARVLEDAGVRDADELTSAYYGRAGASDAAFAVLAATVLTASHDGDPSATAILDRHAQQCAEFVAVAARRVGLAEPYDVALSGGLLRHGTSSLVTALTRALPGVQLRLSERQPVLGSLMYALSEVGVRGDLPRLDATAPAAHVFDTR